ITENFLQYLKELDKLNIEVASEFILVAAKLMRIKAKMLLPRPQLDEEGNEIDPREELVMHLLEYKKYKSVLQELASMESDMFQKEKRGNVLKEIKKLSETVNVESELQDIDLYKLLKVYQKVLKRFEIESQKPTHQVVQYPFTVEQQKDFILNKVMEKKKLSFTQIVEYNREKIGVIYNFLAILELLQLQQIMIRIGEGYNNFWIERLEKELA
ncbi:MAG: segregation/condensation protein A, partial [Cyclobacteriaceae bacterium]|nr:segregation/condensation protein A [Cyclobacteriaceae bacterium]